MRYFRRKPGLVCPIIVTVGAISIGCGLLSSCGPDFSSKAKPSVLRKPSVSKDLNNKSTTVTVEIIGIEAFRYQATIKWLDSTSNVSVYINKQFAFKAESPSVTSYSVGLDHDREYLISVYSQQESLEKPILISELTITTPLDVLLSSVFLKSFLPTENIISIQAHRVFITNEVVTEGKSLFVNTDELIADHAKLLTFREHQKAPMDSQGRHGGRFIFKIKKAFGSLDFFLRGENGGDGSQGAPYTERAPRGPNGKDGSIVTCDAEERRCKTTCSPWPENGHQGLPGKVGNPGGNGRYGGNSGSLQLEISEASPDFHFKIEKGIGTAGSPGSGGPGQDGGLGGLPGKFSEYCKATVGPEGSTGLIGADGVREHNGVIENDCVSIGEGFGRCS